VVTTSELDLAADESSLLADVVRARAEGTHDLLELVGEHDGERPVRPALQSSDVALLTYTSGTTGPPKGAMTTHGNAVFNAQTFRDWVGLNGDDVVLGVAPLFHITGLIAHIAVSLLIGAPLVLTYRFDVSEVLRTVRDERATFMVGSITVFIALMNAADGDPDALTSLRAIYSGGAPIAPATARAFQQRFRIYLHNIYGLTETTSPAMSVPFGVEAPVDPVSGALAVGIPVFDTTVRILDEAGAPCAPGTIGEIAVSGPQVCAGYWRKPAETAQAFVAGELRTGDVGFMDEHGWFYLVDRKKDQINAGGYKVWPREVEDVLYEHPAVREAAVVGVTDDYRGETVKAYVSLVPGADATAQELIAFARERMAAYKYPRLLELVDDIPKTTSGKLLRRALRDPT
jgi:long-chain acyl-CoA synthetase